MTASLKNEFVWFELLAPKSDLAKAAGFYGEVFGWTTGKMSADGHDYTTLNAAGTPIGGLVTPPSPTPTMWLAHLAVASAEATIAKVKAAGGSVMMPPTAISQMGTMAVVADPAGATFALWQASKPEPKPAPAAGHFAWNELAVADPARIVDFYKAIANLTVDRMEMPGFGTYHVLKSGDKGVAGVSAPMMPNQPARWLPYVQVASTDATLARATKLGAKAVVPAMDIPNVGRIAVFVDPIGAGLGLLQPAA